MEDVSSYLASKGIRTYRTGGREITAHCWFCDDGNPKGRGKLYLNTDSWLWSCFRCGTAGNRKTLLRHFGDEDNTAYLPGQDPGKRRKALSDAADLAAEMLLNNPAVIEYLKGRGLTLDTILERRLGYVPPSWSLGLSLRSEVLGHRDLINAGLLTDKGQEAFSDQITIPYLSHGDVVQLRGKTIGGKYFTPFGDNVRLFNADTIRDNTEIILTEGEFDAMILHQTLQLSGNARLKRIAVVAIAGVQSLPDHFEDYFATASKVYLALDPDDEGKKASARIKQALGSKARIVELPGELPKCDWTEYLRPKSPEAPHGGHGWRDVEALLALADQAGRRLISSREAYLAWSRIESEVGGIKLGWSELDAWISPGLKPGQLMVPLAKTGTGKTNLLNNIAWACRERPVLYVSLEMSAAEVYERLRRLSYFYNPLWTEDEVTDSFRKLRIVDSKMKEGDLTVLLQEYRDETGENAQLAFVDYLGYYSAGVRGSTPYERVTRAALSLKEEAKAGGVALIAPHQVNRMAEDGKPLSASDARDSGAVEETADILLSIYRPSDAIKGDHDATIRVGILKNRNGSKGMTTSLKFSTASLVLVDAATSASRTVDEENYLIWRGESYDAVRQMRIKSASTNNQLRIA